MSGESAIKIMCVGDVCGTAGLDILSKTLRRAKSRHRADFVIVNGENTALYGLTEEHAEAIFSAGADVVTLGNHAFSGRNIRPYLDECPYILRPANMKSPLPGRGAAVFPFEKNGKRIDILVAVLSGRVNMGFFCDSPFEEADRILEKHRADIYLFEIHAEATSEKAAFARYLAGRASAVFGSHTHVRTDDARLLGETGFITDIGMTGPDESIIGVSVESSLRFFLSGGVDKKFKTAEGAGELSGALFTISDRGKCLEAVTICER